MNCFLIIPFGVQPDPMFMVYSSVDWQAMHQRYPQHFVMQIEDQGEDILERISCSVDGVECAKLYDDR